MTPRLAAAINRVDLLGLDAAAQDDATAVAALIDAGLIVDEEPTELAYAHLAEYETDVLFDVFWTDSAGSVHHGLFLLPPSSSLADVLAAAAPSIRDGRCHDVQGPTGGWVAGERGAAFEDADPSDVVLTLWDEGDTGPAVLVACSLGKVEVDHPVPALELYNGPMFTMRRRWAAARHGRVAGILSAKYGLLLPGEPAEWYDLALPKQPAAARRAWARRTAWMIAATFPRSTAIIIRGGAHYGSVVNHLPGWDIQRPKFGGIGYERQALKRELEACHTTVQ